MNRMTRDREYDAMRKLIWKIEELVNDKQLAEGDRVFGCKLLLDDFRRLRSEAVI